jgi:catalase
MDKPGDAIKGRRVAILAGDGVSAKQLKAIQKALAAEEAIAEVIADHAGTIEADDGSEQKVNRAAPNAASVIYDAVVVPGGDSAAVLAASGLAVHFVNEAFRHGKPIAAFGEGKELLSAANLQADAELGVIVEESVAMALFIEAMKQHRFPRRNIAGVPA